MPCVCIVPAVEGIGGMSAFRQKFEAGLQQRGIQITHDPDQECDSVLIIAGTRHLAPILRARRRGVRIVQRLDGINWVHRRRNTGLHHFLRAEYGNLLLSLIRSRLATHIVYQSEFARRWWSDWYGDPAKPSSVVHNGVDTDEYTPRGEGAPPADRLRLLVVEGSLGGGYDMGLDNALELAHLLHQEHGLPMEVFVVGRIDPAHQARVQARATVPLIWAGVLGRLRLPEVYRSAHLFFSADLHPACPNAVIEALACGLPMVAFDTGALNELVLGDSGRLVPYGADAWRLEKPNVRALARAAVEILENRERFSAAARQHAEQNLGLDRMMTGYLKALLEA